MEIEVEDCSSESEVGSDSESDPDFEKFRDFVEKQPDQILVYNYGGKPIWFSSKEKLETPPPSCPSCGAERVFEFQIQPQLCDEDNFSKLDFGIIAVYTCMENCLSTKDSLRGGYSEEYSYKQPGF